MAKQERIQMEKPCILIVEELDELTSLMLEAPSAPKFDIIPVSNLVHLRKALVEHTFDLIIIDLFMPESEQFRLIIDLADIHCRSPLIFVSDGNSMALNVAGKIARTKKLNLIELFNKPIQSETVRAILNKATQNILTA